MGCTCDKVDEGIIVISGKVDEDGALTSKPEVHFPGSTILGNDNTVAETLSYSEAFKRLMEECPCRLKALLLEAKLLEKTLE